MAETLKTAALTAEDLITPPGAVIGGSITGNAAVTYRPGAGLGEKGELCEVNGVITPTAASTSPSVYQMARVPTKSVIKHIWTVNTLGGLVVTGDVTLYYSTDTQDGTLPALQGTQVVAALFSAAHAFGSDAAGVPVELTYSNPAAGKYGQLNVDRRNQPIWQAAGLAGDPGGYFDIVIVTTATNGALAAGAAIQFNVQYMAPGTV